jgi:hypothetical protein
MTDQELNALETLHKKATPGPWYVSNTGEGQPCVSYSEESDYHGYPVAIQGMIFAANNANMEFIAAARTAVPELIEEVRMLREELEGADDYCRKLVALIKKHFPTVDPGRIKEADAEIEEILRGKDRTEEKHV